MSQAVVPRFALSTCTAEHIGDRPEQQDRAAVLTSPRYPGVLLAVLADGMGGRSGGRLASDQVVDTARSLFNDLSARDADLEELLGRLAAESHRIIRLSALTAEKEPHSTVVALAIKRDRALWAHVGDSRLYRVRAGRTLTRTVDHSYAEYLLSVTHGAEAARIAERFRHYLTNALGMARPPAPTFAGTVDLELGDVFFLCSDGVWTHFADREIATLLTALTPREAADNLIRIARQRAGGRGDNLSLAIVKLEAPAPG